MYECMVCMYACMGSGCLEAETPGAGLVCVESAPWGCLHGKQASALMACLAGA